MEEVQRKMLVVVLLCLLEVRRRRRVQEDLENLLLLFDPRDVQDYLDGIPTSTRQPVHWRCRWWERRGRFLPSRRFKTLFRVNQEYDEITANTRRGFIHHSLSDTAAREILRSSYVNTFFTNGVEGNPYRSVHTVDGSSLLIEEAVQAMAEDDSRLHPLNCAAGTMEDEIPVVTLANFLASPGLQADRVHVVGAGEFSWEIEEETTSEFFTEQEWEGDDLLTILVLSLVFVFVVLGAMYEEYVSRATNPRSVGVLAMAGSLVGRITMVLIVAEGANFLATSSRGGGFTERDADEAAVAALIYKYTSWLHLLSIVVGDGICAPRCWFTHDDRPHDAG
ncbi:unnamed protein product [Pylaiella littoralis]